MKLIPNLVFDHAKTVIEHYKTIFSDVKIVQLHPYTPEVGKQYNLPANFDYANSCMHAEIQIHGQTLYLSDAPMYPKVEPGNMFSLCLVLEKNFDAFKMYDGMIKHGSKVIMPLAKQFWNANFGIVQDKFGVTWQINQNL